jgi:hypothetical protein
MTNYTGLWFLLRYPLTLISCELDEYLWMYHIRVTTYHYGAPDRHGDSYLPFYLLASAKFPHDILEAAMMEAVERCGIPRREVATLVKHRIGRDAVTEIIENSIRRYIETCTITTQYNSQPESPSVVCDQCSNAVYAVIEDSVLVFPVYTSTRFPTHQLCESCFTQAEQEGRAKVTIRQREDVAG